MATGLLKGLGSMAEQLGGTLGGNVKVSLGMRNKDFVVDPTGGGRTKGAGVKNFGKMKRLRLHTSRNWQSSKVLSLVSVLERRPLFALAMT